MSVTSSNNKRIAKNTLLLYFRTILIMLINLYMSRVVLEALGVEDFGIYNAVGGVVAMFSVISGALSSAISRFITYELGKGDTSRLNKIFSTSVNIQVGLCLVILVVAEPLGIWFLNTHMSIPDGRMEAANWVLQFSLLSFCINLISVPYNAAIIAHERMSAFAYISIVEALLRLGVVFTLTVTMFDKLVSYAFLLVMVALTVRVLYSIYCNRNFEECHYKWIYDKPILKEMTGFAGWSFLTNTAYIFNTQGVNILINLFFGVTLNAARGIATQVDAAVMQFVNNFTMALNPQITKSYAQGDIAQMTKLVFLGAKFTTYMTFFFAIPLIAETDYVLSVWLKEVPEHSAMFVRLGIIAAIIDRFGMTCSTAYSATGKIKDYVVWVSVAGCLVFPLTWGCFQLGMAPESAYLSFIVTYILVDAVRLYMMKRRFDFPVMRFMLGVAGRIFVTLLPCLILPTVTIHTMDSSFLRLVVTTVGSTLSTAIFVYIIGLTSNEQETVKRLIRNKIHFKK